MNRVMGKGVLLVKNPDKYVGTNQLIEVIYIKF